MVAIQYYKVHSKVFLGFLGDGKLYIFLEREKVLDEVTPREKNEIHLKLLEKLSFFISIN